MKCARLLQWPGHLHSWCPHASLGHLVQVDQPSSSLESEGLWEGKALMKAKTHGEGLRPKPSMHKQVHTEAASVALTCELLMVKA